MGGPGIGLSITRQLVTLHGGEIFVESVPGEGSRFAFTIPLASEKIIADDRPTPASDDPARIAILPITDEFQPAIAAQQRDRRESFPYFDCR